MKDFKRIYDSTDAKRAQNRYVKSLAIYCVAALLFVAFCAAFVLLFVFAELNVFVCFALNVVASIAFGWYSVLFFGVTFPDAKADRKFYAIEENALPTRIRGSFTGCGDAGVQERIEYKKLFFSASDGDKTLLIRSEKANPFREGTVYDLCAIGGRIFSYREADDE